MGWGTLVRSWEGEMEGFWVSADGRGKEALRVEAVAAC